MSAPAPKPHRAGGTDHADGAPVVYTPGQAAAILKVRESWLRRKAAARQIPCTFLGRHLRFTAADLHAICQAGAQPGPRHVTGRRTRPR